MRGLVLPGKIFINYRRDDSKADARGLHDRLSRTFGKARVFMDVDNLLAGQRFDQELEKALDSCDIFLAVIGPQWLEILNARKAQEERDYVREEIAAALKRKIIVIPVLVDGTALPTKAALPEDLHELVLYQKHEISHEKFGRDVEELITAIKVVMKQKHPPRDIPFKKIAAGLMICGLIGTGVYAYPFLSSTINTAFENATKRAAQKAAIAEQQAKEAQRRAQGQRQKQKELEKQTAEQAEAKRKAKEEEQERKTKKIHAEYLFQQAEDHFHPDNRTDQDLKQAFQLSKQAAALGHAGAMYRLGVLYDNGLGIAQDKAKANEWYKKAFKPLQALTQQDRTDAQFFLGDMYQAGLGIDKDFKKALKLYQKAANKGFASAMSGLGFIYNNGEGVEKNYAKAIEWYQKAANKGNSIAMTNLGNMYENGEGVEKDLSKAIQWYQKASNKGNAPAMTNLGVMYDDGEGVEKDQSKAFQLFQKAANKGFAPAMAYLGMMYDFGQSVEKDATKAANWMIQALKKKNKFSIKQMVTNSNSWSEAFRKELQVKLKQEGFYSGPIDGQFGAETINAIKKLAGQKKIQIRLSQENLNICGTFDEFSCDTAEPFCVWQEFDRECISAPNHRLRSPKISLRERSQQFCNALPENNCNLNLTRCKWNGAICDIKK